LRRVVEALDARLRVEILANLGRTEPIVAEKGQKYKS
jgi:hypothetical protein